MRRGRRGDPPKRVFTQVTESHFGELSADGSTQLMVLRTELLWTTICEVEEALSGNSAPMDAL